MWLLDHLPKPAFEFECTDFLMLLKKSNSVKYVLCNESTIIQIRGFIVENYVNMLKLAADMLKIRG